LGSLIGLSYIRYIIACVVVKRVSPSATYPSIRTPPMHPQDKSIMSTLLMMEPKVVAALSIAFAVGVYVNLLSGSAQTRKFWLNQPAMGPANKFLGETRASLASFTSTKQWVLEGYRKYSKAGSFFSVFTIDRGSLLVVPQSLVKTIYSLPEQVLDVLVTANESIQTKWTVWDTEVDGKPFHMDVIRNQITRNLGLLTRPIAAEIDFAFKREWGTSTTQWKLIDPWPSALRIVAGAANAAFCGPALCRDDAFLERLGAHAMCMFGGSILISLTPGPVRWISGYTIGMMSWILFRRVTSIAQPVVEERLRNTARLREDTSYDWTPPQDGLQWLIDEAHATGEPHQLDAERITHRLAFINDISMHSTGYTAQHVILDLAKSDPSLGYIQALRDEAAAVLKETGGVWTRQGVTKLHLIDSTIRESMRMSPFFSVGLPRTVIDPHGITVPHGDSTVRIPKGALLGIPVQAIHYDETIYPNANEFQPFRFTQTQRIDNVADAFRDVDSKEAAAQPGGQVKTSATLDGSFLSFGYGKHACPGRFFALNELKMFVAEMVLKYNIEYVGTDQPRTMPILWLNVPNFFTSPKVRVQRREPVELL
jgi:hypothetical protein